MFIRLCFLPASKHCPSCSSVAVGLFSSWLTINQWDGEEQHKFIDPTKADWLLKYPHTTLSCLGIASTQEAEEDRVGGQDRQAGPFRETLSQTNKQKSLFCFVLLVFVVVVLFWVGTTNQGWVTFQSKPTEGPGLFYKKHSLVHMWKGCATIPQVRVLTANRSILNHLQK